MNHEAMSIGDVSRIADVPIHTIRFWEQQFDRYLRPERTAGGQRRYTDEAIAGVLRIKELLWQRGFSIKAARRILERGCNTEQRACGALVGEVFDMLHRRMSAQSVA